MNKYHAVKTVVEGITFDSAKEAARWDELVLCQKAGNISNLRRQVKYSLDVNGFHVCVYKADFVYNENGREIVEDVKSGPTKTPLYRIKKKLMRAIYGIEVRETE